MDMHIVFELDKYNDIHEAWWNLDFQLMGVDTAQSGRGLKFFARFAQQLLSTPPYKKP